MTGKHIHEESYDKYAPDEESDEYEYGDAPDEESDEYEYGVTLDEKHDEYEYEYAS